MAESCETKCEMNDAVKEKDERCPIKAKTQQFLKVQLPLFIYPLVNYDVEIVAIFASCLSLLTTNSRWCHSALVTSLQYSHFYVYIYVFF